MKLLRCLRQQTELSGMIMIIQVIIIQMTQISSLLYLDKLLGSGTSAVCGSVGRHVWISM